MEKITYPQGKTLSFFLVFLVFTGCSLLPPGSLPSWQKPRMNQEQDIEEEKGENIIEQENIIIEDVLIEEASLDPSSPYPLQEEEQMQEEDPLLSQPSAVILLEDPNSSTILELEEVEDEIDADSPTEEEETSSAERMQEKLDLALHLCQEAQKAWEESDIEKAIDNLDLAFEFLINVNPDDDSNLLQQKDDLRFLISRRMVEIYASRQTRIEGTHHEIPLIMNEHVQKEIDSFLTVERKYFLEGYRRSGLYSSLIMQQLKEAGLPEKLFWLPLIESLFKGNALSRARALGLWQFIPSTGYKFGLKRDNWIDERMDPIKSTRAAIAYLTELHKIFGDWTTALAAYNCGEGKVLSVIQKQHLNYLDNFWDLYQRLPHETARYVPRFFAAIHIIENPDRFGIDLGQAFPPLEYEELTIHKQVLLKELAEKSGLEEETLKLLNPELRYQATPDYQYQLRVPPNTKENIESCLASIQHWTSPTPPPPEPKKSSRIVSSSRTSPKYITVSIKKGETLSAIAKRYGSSVKAIMQANHITKANQISIGRKIRVPLETKAEAAKSKGKNKTSQVKIYKVRKGDCPASIAKNHKMKVKEFLSLNGLSSKSRLYPGQRVLIKFN